MDSEKLMTLARADFEQQEKYSDSLSRAVQFTLTLGTLIGTASVAMFKVRMLETIDRVEVVFYWLCGVAMWVALGWAVYQIARALWAQKLAVPRALDQYLKWVSDRQAQLCAAGYNDEQALQEARAAVIDHITAAYADAAGINRTANISRQRAVARATVRLILAGIFLAGQAACNCVFVYREAVNGRASTIGGGSGRATDNSASTSASAPAR